MTASSVPLTECASWCRDGDGHPRQISATDQWCWSEYADVHSSMADGQVGAYVRRNVDQEPFVEVHVYGFRNELDEQLQFSADEARQLAQALIAAADLITSE